MTAPSKGQKEIAREIVKLSKGRPDDIRGMLIAIAIQEAESAGYNKCAKQYKDVLKKEISEAVMEERELCARIAADRASLWRSVGGVKMAGSSGHLSVEGECDLIADLILKRKPRSRSEKPQKRGGK